MVFNHITVTNGFLMKAQRFSRTIMAAAIGMALCGTAVAREVVESGVTISAGAAYNMLDSVRGLDDKVAPEVGIGYRFNDRFSVEGSYSQYSSDAKNGSTSDLDEISLNGFVDLTPWDGSYTPYFVAGVSMMDVNPQPGRIQDETRMNAGFGVRKAISSNLALRGDVRAVRTLDYHQTEGQVNLALTWTFGSVAPAAEPVAVVEEPVVEEVVVVEPVILDGDNDGIVDADDLCLESAAGAVVDATGCEQMEAQVLFSFDSADIRAEDQAIIARVGEFLQRNDGLTVSIAGYTDSTGTSEYNQALSLQRAEAVRQALVEDFGIDSSRMEVDAMGESDPIAGNDTLEGREDNRRVVMISVVPQA